MKQRGNTLVSVLLTLTIMAMLGVALFYGSGAFRAPGDHPSARADGKGTTIPGLVKLDAQDEVCRSNIGQVRQSLMINSNADEAYPETLMDLKLGKDFTQCPLGREPYVYDPTTCTVSCPHPGHEKY
ncbi:MAG: type II secretion system protein [Fimbriimonas sp.]